MMLSAETVAEIEQALQEVASTTGWGEVTLIVEYGRLRKLKRERSQWLGRGDPPPATEKQQGRS